MTGAVGVDVGGTGTKAAIVARDGTVVLRAERPTDPSAGTKGIVAIVEDLIQEAPGTGAKVEGIGVGAAGFIDADRGAATFSPNLTYEDPQIADALRAHFGLPVVVDNDANAACWGERAHGAAVGCDHVAYVTIGTGIGSGFVVDGRLLRGATGAGAEFGHVVIDPEGPPCNCGLKGCLEQFASGQAIAREAKRAVGDDPSSSILDFAGSAEAITAEHVARAARQYDETARAVLRVAGKHLAIGLSNAANVFDPEVIVLSGSVIKAGEPFLGPARDGLFEMTTAQRRRPMRLEMTTLRGDAGIVGAASLAFVEAR